MNTDGDILTGIDAAFCGIGRPEHFTNFTHCEECAEHDELLRMRDRETLCLEDVGNPGWDPICFCSSSGSPTTSLRLHALPWPSRVPSSTIGTPINYCSTSIPASQRMLSSNIAAALSARHSRGSLLTSSKHGHPSSTFTPRLTNSFGVTNCGVTPLTLDVRGSHG